MTSELYTVCLFQLENMHTKKTKHHLLFDLSIWWVLNIFWKSCIICYRKGYNGRINRCCRLLHFIPHLAGRISKLRTKQKEKKKKKENKSQNPVFLSNALVNCCFLEHCFTSILVYLLLYFHLLYYFIFSYTQQRLLPKALVFNCCLYFVV